MATTKDVLSSRNLLLGLGLGSSLFGARLLRLCTATFALLLIELGHFLHLGLDRFPVSLCQQRALILVEKPDEIVDLGNDRSDLFVTQVIHEHVGQADKETQQVLAAVNLGIRRFAIQNSDLWQLFSVQEIGF